MSRTRTAPSERPAENGLAGGNKTTGPRCRARRLRVRTRLVTNESGFTLIEEIVALALLAVVLLPIATIYYTGQKGSADNREYGDAVAIASGAVAQANGITYSDLGFFESQFGTPPQTVPGYNGLPGVDLGANPPAGVAPQIQPTGTPVQVGSIVYHERTYVVWVNASGGNAYAYKQVYAVVSWNENGNPVSTTQSVLVDPGGLGKYTVPENNTPGGTSSTPSNVDGLAATVPADPAGEQQVNLTWDAPLTDPGFYAAVSAPDPGAQSNLAVPDTSGTSSAWSPTGSTASGSILGTATNFTVTGLAASTTYWFEIVAFSSDGVQWAISQTWVKATTLTPTVQPCTLNTLTVSQAGQLSGQATVAKSGGDLIQPITVIVTYVGNCTSGADAVTVVAGTSSGVDPGSPYTLSWSSSPAQYSYTLCPVGVGFITGIHNYTASLNGTASNLTAQVSFTRDKKTTPSC